MASLLLHLAHLSSGYSWLLCPLFFSLPRNLPHLAPSLFRPELLSFPLSSPLASDNGSLGPTVGADVLVGERHSGSDAVVVVVRRCRRGGGAGVVVGGGPVRREGKE